MGGALGGIFSGVGQGANGAPSVLQKVVQGAAKGAGTGFGKAMQPQGRTMGGGNGAPGAPSATPVDSGYFAPSAVPPHAMLPPGTMAGRPPMPLPSAGPSPFYAQ